VGSNAVSSWQQELTIKQTANEVLQSKKKSCSSAWLEHYTDNVGVSSSNLLGTTIEAESKRPKAKSRKLQVRKIVRKSIKL
jgi:hypothetical protein